MNRTERLRHYEQMVLNLTEFPDQEWVLELFRFQATTNPVYKKYLALLGKDPSRVSKLDDIPFLPIEFFKNHSVKAGSWNHQQVFTSSGTTGQQTSKHYLYSESFYKQHSQNCFEFFYGDLKEYCVLALLPAYLERKGSSLVYMADHFIKTSTDVDSGFFLDDWRSLATVLQKKKQSDQKTLLLGVSFAIMDFSEQYSMDLSDIIIMETGGMKGRRAEIPRSEMHASVSVLFNIEHVHSEYGMTELLSQAYSKGKGVFALPPSMKFMIHDMTDPFNLAKAGKSGVLNIIDLANFSTCSFIETGDLAREISDGEFEILGRLDRAMLRGCNLMYTSLS